MSSTRQEFYEKHSAFGDDLLTRSTSGADVVCRSTLIFSNLQLLLQQIQFDAAGVAELPQPILAIHGVRFNLLDCRVGLWIRAHNSFYDLLSFLQNGLRRTEPDAAQQRVSW